MGAAATAARCRAQRNIIKPRDWQRYPYPFIYGQIDPSQLPMPGWRECSLQATSASEVRGWAADLFDGDDALLIEQIQTRLLVRRGMFVSPDEIPCVTVGAQHAPVHAAGTLLVDAGTTVGIENPGYPDARNIFASRTPSVVPLPLDGGGLALSPGLDRCDYVYLTPSHQCPTNVTMPLARRAGAARRGRRRQRPRADRGRLRDRGSGSRAARIRRCKSLDRSGHAYLRQQPVEDARAAASASASSSPTAT